MAFDLKDPRKLALVGIMTALVLAMTRSAVPNGIGYNHLGDVAIFFTSFAFGPWAGMIAGGIGTALADLLSGEYAAFAPLSLLVHGLQGFVAGWIYLKRPDNTGLILGVVVGGVIIVGGYFLGEALVPLWGVGDAVGELLPNTVQALIGAVGAVVYVAVKRAYPQLQSAA